MTIARSGGFFLSVEEVAALLWMGERTLYRRIKLGTSPIEPVRLGNRWAFRVTDVESFCGRSLSQ